MYARGCKSGGIYDAQRYQLNRLGMDLAFR